MSFLSHWCQAELRTVQMTLRVTNEVPWDGWPPEWRSCIFVCTEISLRCLHSKNILHHCTTIEWGNSSPIECQGNNQGVSKNDKPVFFRSAEDGFPVSKQFLFTLLGLKDYLKKPTDNLLENAPSVEVDPPAFNGELLHHRVWETTNLRNVPCEMQKLWHCVDVRIFPFVLEKTALLISITVSWQMTCSVKEVVLDWPDFSLPWLLVCEELSSLQASMLKVRVQQHACGLRWENFITLKGQHRWDRPTIGNYKSRIRILFDSLQLFGWDCSVTWINW